MMQFGSRDRHSLALVLLCAAVTAAMPNFKAGAQTVAEAIDGSSGIAMWSGGLATVNFGESSVGFGYTRLHSESRLRFGAEAKAIANNGFSSLFTNGRLSATGQGVLFGGWTLPYTEGSTAVFQWFTAAMSFSRGTLDLASDSASAQKLEHSRVFAGATLTAFYDAFFQNLPMFHDLLIGVSGGFGRRNNYTDLSSAEVCTNLASTEPETVPAQVVQRCKEARTGTYVVRNAWAGAFDGLWYQNWTKNVLSIDFFARYRAIESGSRWSPGLGLMLAKPGAPRTILGGATLEWQGGSRPRFGLQAGLAF